jgi:hypothetical protein
MTDTGQIPFTGMNKILPRQARTAAARIVRRNWMVAAVLLGAVVVQLAFVASFTGANARPVLHNVTVGLAGAAPTPVGRGDSVVSYQRFPSAAAARQAVSDGSLPAALVVTGHRQTLVVAQAAGYSLTAAVEQGATAAAAAAHSRLAIQDVRPLPAGDPRGLAMFFLVIAWVIGGTPGMILLSRLLGARARGLRGTATLTAWTAGYALASAGLGVVLADPLMGALTGHPWALLGAGTLFVFAIAMSAAALMSLIGMAGIAVAAVAFVILGNPTSGGSVPVQMLSSGFRFLADVLPNNAGVTAIREIEYFGGNGTGHPLLVLALYAAIATAVCFAQALRRSRPAPPALPAAQPVAPPAAQPAAR